MESLRASDRQMLLEEVDATLPSDGAVLGMEIGPLRLSKTVYPIWNDNGFNRHSRKCCFEFFHPLRRVLRI